MTAVRTQTIFPNKGFVFCIDGAFMGWSTSATAFNEAMWYFAYTI